MTIRIRKLTHASKKRIFWKNKENALLAGNKNGVRQHTRASVKSFFKEIREKNK